MLIASAIAAENLPMYEAVIRLWMISAIGMDVKKTREADAELLD